MPMSLAHNADDILNDPTLINVVLEQFQKEGTGPEWKKIMHANDSALVHAIASIFEAIDFDSPLYSPTVELILIFTNLSPKHVGVILGRDYMCPSKLINQDGKVETVSMRLEILDCILRHCPKSQLKIPCVENLNAVVEDLFDCLSIQCDNDRFCKLVVECLLVLDNTSYEDSYVLINQALHSNAATFAFELIQILRQRNTEHPYLLAILKFIEEVANDQGSDSKQSSPSSTPLCTFFSEQHIVEIFQLFVTCYLNAQDQFVVLQSLQSLSALSSNSSVKCVSKSVHQTVCQSVEQLMESQDDKAAERTTDEAQFAHLIKDLAKQSIKGIKKAYERYLLAKKGEQGEVDRKEDGKSRNSSSEGRNRSSKRRNRTSTLGRLARRKKEKEQAAALAAKVPSLLSLFPSARSIPSSASSIAIPTPDAGIVAPSWSSQLPFSKDEEENSVLSAAIDQQPGGLIQVDLSVLDASSLNSNVLAEKVMSLAQHLGESGSENEWKALIESDDLWLISLLGRLVLCSSHLFSTPQDEQKGTSDASDGDNDDEDDNGQDGIDGSDNQVVTTLFNILSFFCGMSPFVSPTLILKLNMLRSLTVDIQRMLDSSSSANLIPHLQLLLSLLLNSRPSLVAAVGEEQLSSSISTLLSTMLNNPMDDVASLCVQCSLLMNGSMKNHGKLLLLDCVMKQPDLPHSELTQRIVNIVNKEQDSRLIGVALSLIQQTFLSNNYDFFYTNDVNVLVEILDRLLNDTEPPNKLIIQLVRSLAAILTWPEYKTECTRQQELITTLEFVMSSCEKHGTREPETQSVMQAVSGTCQIVISNLKKMSE